MRAQVLGVVGAAIPVALWAAAFVWACRGVNASRDVLPVVVAFPLIDPLLLVPCFILAGKGYEWGRRLDDEAERRRWLGRVRPQRPA